MRSYVFIGSLKKRIYDHIEHDLKESFNPLSYDKFIELQKEGKITAEETEELLDYAEEVGSLILFRKAEEKITPDMYSLNFLWIHAKFLEEPGHLMGSDDNSLRKNIIYPILDWHVKQPEANINLWYDGKMIKNPASTIASTLKVLSNYEFVDLSKIKFRDIREIDLANENHDLFEEEIGIFFRVDLAKALIADHITRNGKIAVNIDYDIVAIPNEHLFDLKTLTKLKK